MRFSRSIAATGARMRPAVRKGVSMSMEVDGAQFLLSAVQNVPFVDELTGEPQGFTSPVNHFLSVIGLWVRGTIHRVACRWSACFKQSFIGADNLTKPA